MPRVNPKHLDPSYGNREHQLAVAESLSYLEGIGCDDGYLGVCRRALRTAHDIGKNVILVYDPNTNQPHGQPYRLVRQDEIVRGNGFGNNDVALPNGSLIH